MGLYVPLSRKIYIFKTQKWRVVVHSNALFLGFLRMKLQVLGSAVLRWGYNPAFFLNLKCKILHSGAPHSSSAPKVGGAIADPAPHSSAPDDGRRNGNRYGAYFHHATEIGEVSLARGKHVTWQKVKAVASLKIQQHLMLCIADRLVSLYDILNIQNVSDHFQGWLEFNGTFNTI